MSSSCVTRTIVIPFALRSFNIFIISKPVLLSKAPVGSSAKINLGEPAIALAIDTLCC